MAQTGSGETTLTAVLRLRDEMSGQLQKPQAALTNLGKTTEGLQKTSTAAFSGIGEALKKASTGFGLMDASSARFLARSVSMSNRLLGIAIAAEGLSKKGAGFNAASEAMRTFALIAMMVPGPIGLIGGAVGGALVGIKRWTEGQKEAIEKMKEMRAEAELVAKAVLETRGKQLADILLSKNPDLAQNKVDVENTVREIERLYGKLTEAQIRMNENKGRPLSEEFLKAKETALDLGEEVETTTKKLKDMNDESNRLTITEEMKELGNAFDIVHEKVNSGLISPMDAAKERLNAVEKAMADLIKVQKSFSPEEFDKKMFDLMTKRNAERTILDADKMSKELEKVKGDIEDWQKDTSIILSDAAVHQLQLLGVKSKEELRKALDEIQKQVEADPLMGLELALVDLTKKTYSFRSAWGQVFNDLEKGFSNAFADAILSGKKFSDSFKGIVKALKADLVRMFTDSVSRQLFGGLSGLLFGGGGAGGTATGVGGQGGVGAAGGGGAGMLGTGLGATSSIGASSGLGNVANAALGLVGAAGGVMLQLGMQKGNITQGVLGGAMSGAAMGTAIYPGIGTVVGAVLGAVGGYFASSSAKKKLDAAKKKAKKQYMKALAEARVALKTDIRHRMGGGLATEDAAAEIGQLFSEDLSEAEIKKFGDPRQIAQAAGATTKNVNVGGITVNAEISGEYDVQRLAQDLGYHLQNQMGGAAGGI